MRKAPLTDSDCYRAAVRRLADHLATRPATKAEIASEIDRLYAEAAAIIEVANAAPLPLLPGHLPASRAEAIAEADRLLSRARALEAIADSPLHAWNQTTKALIERAAFYAARLK